MTPVTPVEEALWRFLPPAIWWLTFVAFVCAMVSLVMAWRVSKKGGYAFLAAAAAIPVMLSVAAFTRSGSSGVTNDDDIVVVESSTRIDLFAVAILGCVGALSLYRSERKNA